MRAYKREEFIKLPAGTIYSRLGRDYFNGLYSKTTDGEWGDDWVEIDLIAEYRGPKELVDGGDILYHFEQIVKTEQDFETDFSSGCRDGLFNDSDVFIVWDKKDIKK